MKVSKSENFDQVLRKRVSIFEPEKALSNIEYFDLPKKQKSRRASVVDAIEKLVPERRVELYVSIIFGTDRKGR